MFVRLRESRCFASRDKEMDEDTRRDDRHARRRDDRRARRHAQRETLRETQTLALGGGRGEKMGAPGTWEEESEGRWRKPSRWAHGMHVLLCLACGACAGRGCGSAGPAAGERGARDESARGGAGAEAA